MALGSYELILTNPLGYPLADIDTITSGQFGKVANQIANFTVTLPKSFDINLVAPDNMLQVWRQPIGGVKSLFNVYFLRRWKFRGQGSNTIVELAGPDLNDILRRRNAIAYSGSSAASKADFADDMMKEILSEALSDSTLPAPSAGTRVLSNLSIQPDLSLGPVLVKNLENGKLLNQGDSGIFADLAKASKVAGNEVFFAIVPDVVSSNSITLKFVTTINQPGSDISLDVVFSQETGNLRDPSLEYDYTIEENYLYAGGQGEASNRNFQQAGDSTRYLLSQWARCEGFIDARDQTANNGVLAQAQKQLTLGRPRINFTGQPIDTEDTRFGIHWNFGDKVRAVYQNIQFDSVIRAVTLNLDSSGREDIAARLDFEGTV